MLEAQTKAKIAVAYFYFDFHDLNKQHAPKLLWSLLAQLSAQNPRLQQIVHAAYASSRNGQLQPTTKAMIVLLRQLVAAFEHVYLLFDALDECAERDELLEVIADISSWKIDAVHMLATSRKESDIQDVLSPLVTYQLCIQSALIHADIRIHISERLTNDSKLKRWLAEDKREIEETLVTGANGM